MSVFNFELLKVPFASGAVLSEIEPFPDYVRGLGIAFEQTDGKPEMKGLNGLFNVITTSMLSLRQRGISEWVTGFDYPVGGFAVESGKLYQAKTLNTSKQPSISQSDWTLWASVSDITVNANGNIKKTSSPNGAFELKVEDANTTTKGAARFATATEVANKANVMAAVMPSNAATIAQSTDLGVGQSYVDLTPSRVPNVYYLNDSGRPILVIICQASDSIPSIIVDGVTVATIDGFPNSVSVSASVVVPNGSRIMITSSFRTWVELR